MAFISVQAQETATLSFADKAQRASFSTTQQVWEQNGITFTNNKSASTTNIADYAKPVRLYANSNIVVECTLGNITSIEFDCNSASYATALNNSIGTTATTSVSSDKVTVTLDGSSNSFTIAKLTAQVRMDALTVTYATSTGVSKPVTPTLTAGGNFVGSIEVEISCATEGAEIYYTTDGTEPTEDSEAYIEPFEITETTTVKAIAINEAGESNVATAVYTRVAATPAITFDGEATFEESVEVAIAAAEGTTAYYTLNGKTPAVDSDECPESLTIKADATLQVIAYDVDGYASPVVKQVFKKASNSSEGAAGTATLVEDAADLAAGDQVVIVAAESNYALSTNQKTNNRGQIAITKEGNDVSLNNDVQVLTLENGTVDGTFAFNTGSGYLYAASSGSNYLKTQDTNNANGSWSIAIENGVATVLANGSNTRNLMQYNKNSSLFACYASDNPQQEISIYKVNLATVEDYVLNVTEAGWATLYLGYNVVIPEDVTCYVISEVAEESVVLEEITDVLPANTAVIVEAEEGEYTFEVTEESAVVESEMLGTTKNEYITKEAYVLSIVNGEVGLYKAAMNGGVWLNNANKAYLPASAANGAASYSFRFEGGTTGVEEVKTENGEVKAIYDLTGRQVNAVERGIYIVNGKKVLVK